MMILVNLINNLDVAREVVAKLRGKNFSIVTCAIKDGQVRDLSTIRDRELADSVPGGFSIKDGITRIPLLPSRSILWDLSEGAVKISFDEREVVIERELPHGKTIYRVVIF